MKKIRALIIQGFPDIRAMLRKMIAEEKDLVLVGEHEDGVTGLEAIHEHRPQLLFLGVQLRGQDGFGLLQSADGVCPPAVIFVSNVERYAVRAFSTHAVDYLLKPFSHERFREAIQRARHRLQQSSRGQERSRPLGTDATPPLIGIKTGGRIVLLRPDEIEVVVAHRTYSTVHTQSGSHRTRSSLSVLQNKLQGKQFVRINRSTLIHTTSVREVVRKTHGDALVRLKNGKEFPLSRRYRSQWSGLIARKNKITSEQSSTFSEGTRRRGADSRDNQGTIETVRK